MKEVRIGLIGYNEGNGHPYSFSAIINGYDPEAMMASPYPGIAEYLSKRKENEFGIGDMKVTSVWAAERSIAENIALCSKIPLVVNHYQDMAGSVDAVIIARDDIKFHKEISSYFLEKKIPVFLDKPLCNNLDDLHFYTPFLRSGLLISCSGLRFYPSIESKFEGLLAPKDIIFSHSVSIIEWFRYGIHVVEGIVPVMGADVEWVQNTGDIGDEIVRIQYKNGRYALIQVNAKLGFVLRSSFYTSKQHFTVNYDDNFTCFKSMLKLFYNQIMSGEPSIDPDETICIMKILIGARLSQSKAGMKIYLDSI